MFGFSSGKHPHGLPDAPGAVESAVGKEDALPSCIHVQTATEPSVLIQPSKSEGYPS